MRAWRKSRNCRNNSCKLSLDKITFIFARVEEPNSAKSDGRSLQDNAKMSLMSGTREQLVAAFTKERQNLQQLLEIEKGKPPKERDSEKIEFYLSEIESLDLDIRALITKP